MNMDPRLRGFSGSVNGIQLGNLPVSVLQNQNLVSGPELIGTRMDHNFRESDCHPPDPRPTNNVPKPRPFVTPEEDSPEDCDFSDTLLGYISQILMEEDMGDQTCMLQDSLDLQAAEKSFYEVLGQKYPPSPEPSGGYFNQNGQNLCDSLANSCNHNRDFGYGNGSGYLDDIVWNHKKQSVQVNKISQSSYSSPSSAVSSVDSPSSTLQVPEWNSECQPILQFRKGVEEASKFLPVGSDLFLSTEGNGLLCLESKAKTCEVAIKVEKKNEGEGSLGGSRGKKNPRSGYEDMEEGRSSKQLAVSTESSLPTEVFDKVLLYTAGEGRDELVSLREALQKMAIKNGQNRQLDPSTGRKGRGKKGAEKKEVVDLRALLVACAQAVAADDRRTANDLLKQIRQHSFPYGDGNQRLAHCLADGLEARLAGTGSQIYKGLVGKKTSAGDFLKAYRLYLAACPFRHLSNFFSNKTIRNMSANSNRLHVIDFGIDYGFQWPTLIQRLAMQPGAPPKLRITGIDFPQPGFRPAARIEDTGRRLAAYAKKFGITFEYNGIAKKWETIQLEELKLEREEATVVTCLYRAKNLLDETVAVDSPRNIVLNFIRKINPDVFIHGIVNGSFNAPFFVTRFREALFHFSAMFDMLETIVPREDQERMLIEKEIFGRQAMNVIACEGWERVERPETYKQWQVRCIRAGFTQVPFDQDILKRAITKVENYFHKDFLIDEDSKWLLLGWKGRIIFTLSAWKPA